MHKVFRVWGSSSLTIREVTLGLLFKGQIGGRQRVSSLLTVEGFLHLVDVDEILIALILVCMFLLSGLHRERIGRGSTCLLAFAAVQHLLLGLGFSFLHK